MSNNDKVKDTIKNLCNKYNKTSWKNILPPIFETEEFDMAIGQLVSDVQAGQPFTPNLKSILRSFDMCPLNKVKVVIINDHPYPEKGVANGLAFACKINPFIKELNDVTEDKFIDGPTPSLEYLPRNGVMLLNMAMTCPIGKPKDHIPMWEPVTATIIKGINENTTDTIFVFVGEETQPLAEMVTNASHSKLFIPSFDEQTKWDSMDIFLRINKILVKKNRTCVDW